MVQKSGDHHLGWLKTLQIVGSSSLVVKDFVHQQYVSVNFDHVFGQKTNLPLNRHYFDKNICGIRMDNSMPQKNMCIYTYIIYVSIYVYTVHIRKVSNHQTLERYIPPPCHSISPMPQAPPPRLRQRCTTSVGSWCYLSIGSECMTNVKQHWETAISSLSFYVYVYIYILQICWCISI